MSAGTIKIDLDTFLPRFDSEYMYLYNNHIPESEYREAVEDFEYFADHHPSFVGDFVRLRGDAITSDREAAAFMLALNGLVKHSMRYEFY